MKFGSFGLTLKALKSKLRPQEPPVLFTTESMLDNDVNPRPRIPWAPYPNAGLTADDASINA